MTLAVAESCTGGMMGAAITRVPGSSAYFKGGVIAYSNEIKEKVLGVSPELLKSKGAVSREVAIAMAKGGPTYARRPAVSHYPVLQGRTAEV